MNIPNLFFYVKKNGKYDGDILFYVSSDIISILVRTYIPSTIMLIFNTIMIRRILKNNRNISNQTASNRKENQFTVAVIAFDVYFFILNFPLSLFFVFFDINLYSNALQGDKLFNAYYNLIYTITFDISFCKQTFSFFMYSACNKLFRNELLSIIGRIFHIQSLSVSSIHNGINS